jgi:hypothetical protein
MMDPSGLRTDEGWSVKIWPQDDLFDTLYIDTDSDTSLFFEITDTGKVILIR